MCDIYEALYRESIGKRLDYICLLEQIKVILEFPMDDSRRVSEIRARIREFEERKMPAKGQKEER